LFKQIKSPEDVVKFQFQRYMEDYLRCILSVDDNVGRVLNYLKQQHLDSNTIVVYMSDQGFYLGEHGLYDKRFMYEESFRTPMLIKYPSAIQKPRHINSFVLNLDIAPTLLDLAGISVPSDMQGKSIKQLMTEGKDEGWRKEMYYHYYERSFGLTPHYGIRNGRYKLMHFYGAIDSWEFYDLKKDPKEMKNLYGNKNYSKKIEELKTRLSELQQEYKDPVK
jgi:arylsulfatase A-like enzyme